MACVRLARGTGATRVAATLLAVRLSLREVERNGECDERCCFKRHGVGDNGALAVRVEHARGACAYERSNSDEHREQAIRCGALAAGHHVGHRSAHGGLLNAEARAPQNDAEHDECGVVGIDEKRDERRRDGQRKQRLRADFVIERACDQGEYAVDCHGDSVNHRNRGRGDKASGHHVVRHHAEGAHAREHDGAKAGVDPEKQRKELRYFGFQK